MVSFLFCHPPPHTHTKKDKNERVFFLRCYPSILDSVLTQVKTCEQNPDDEQSLHFDPAVDVF